MPAPHQSLFRLYRGAQFLGTGILVSNRHVLTCAHVVERNRKVTARLDGALEAVGKVIGSSREENLDLALLELDTFCGDPPGWSPRVPAGTQVTLCGFSRGEPGDRPLRQVTASAVPHDEGGWTVSLEVPHAGVAHGMSGGVAVALIDLELRCVGLIREGGERALKSLLAGPGDVARFLAGLGLCLPGCPALIDDPADPDQEVRRRYREDLFRRTGQIDIRGFQRSDGKATAFAIEDLYIALQNHQEEEIEKSLRKYRCLVVQGDAGSGKSTFLQHLAHELARGGERFPLPVRVVELDRTIQKELEEPNTPAGGEDPRWLAVHLAAAGWGLDEQFVLRQLRRPETVVLIDGLDEALNQARRRSLAKLLSAAGKQYPKCRFVLTTRPGAYEGEARSQGFAVDTIAPLKPEAVARFFANWSRCVYPDDPSAAEALGVDLERQVGAKEEVREMADNPMMLTALASIHWNEKRLPQDRGELYESIIGWLARQRENRPGRLAEKKCREVLGALALGMQTWPQGRLKQAERDAAVKILTENTKLTLREAREFLAQEELDSGIIVSRGKDAVEFRHLTYQEYLAALEVLEDRSEKEQEEILLTGRQRYSVEWREFLRLLALLARHRKAQWLYEKLLEGAGGSLADRARTVALIRTMAWDRREREGEIEDCRYLAFVREMAGLFEGKADGHALDLWSRAQAAEAWELLVGDRSRLRLPHDESYWSPVDQRFDIGRCPVTVYEYERYLADCPQVEKPRAWTEQSRFPLRPVVDVSLRDAEAYCKWCSGKTGRLIRLPAEDEWYLAAAGAAEPPRDYPWGGGEPNHDLANYDYEVRHVTPVGLFPAGATPGAGILDMAGNVWEWTSSLYSEGREERVLRGGSFSDSARSLRAANRVSNGPDERSNYIGFRCVREVLS
jgi:energy-coupling factor transporter ATP-binding protein EcfA2